MQITIGNINEYKPIKFINNKYVINWGLNNVNNENGQWYYFITDKKPSVYEIKTVIESFINQETNNNIINHFKWNDMKIDLTLEDQMNYKLLFDISLLNDGSNLPEQVKFKINGKTVFYSFETLDDIKSFITEMYNHIRNCILQGNNLKESINYDDYNI